MTSPSNTSAQPSFVSAGEGQAIWFLGSRITIKATAQSTGGAYGLFESWIPPGYSPPLHVHRREDEAFWVLEGELTMRCGDQTFRATTGAFVFLPRDVPHSFVVEGDRPAATDGLPPPAPPDIELLQRVGAQFGSDIIGPPMAPSGK